MKSRLSPSNQVLLQTVGDEAVLLDLKTEQYFGLNPVGLRVWQLLGEQGDSAAVLERLLAEFDVERDRLAGDIEKLVGELLEAGLLESKPAPA